MKKTIKSLLIMSFLFVSTNMLAQDDFIQTVDGKQLWVSIKSEDSETIEIVDGRRNKKIPKSEIVIIEEIEKGLRILQKDKIVPVPVCEFTGNVLDFIASGKRVYVPITDTAIDATQQRFGGRHLRELIMNDKYWKVVGCVEEADFILEYVFDDSGKDHAYLVFSDRNGKDIMQSKSADADFFVPSAAGWSSAENLFKRHILKGIKVGNMKKWKMLTETK